jgi:hypothetical protein
LIKRSEVVGTEVVHDQAHLEGVGVALVEHGLDEVGPVLPRAPLGHCGVAATGQRLDFHEQCGDAMAHVFVVDDLAMAGSGGDRFVHLSDQLLARLIHADNRKDWIAGGDRPSAPLPLPPQRPRLRRAGSSSICSGQAAIRFFLAAVHGHRRNGVHDLQLDELGDCWISRIYRTSEI